MIYILKLGHVPGVQLDSAKSTESLILSIYILCFFGKEQGTASSGVCSKYIFLKLGKSSCTVKQTKVGEWKACTSILRRDIHSVHSPVLSISFDFLWKEIAFFLTLLVSISKERKHLQLLGML